MASWSSKRKLTYITIVIVVFIALIGIPTFYFFYTAPTCFDNVMNGDESGIDCGGACKRLCASAFLQPNVAWTRFEQVAPGLYNVAAYIINPNNDAEAKRVPYRLSLYDNEGIVINEINSFVTLPTHRNTLAFAGAVSVGKRIPTKALFEFTGSPDWKKQTDTLAAIQVADKTYQEEGGSSTLSVVIKNNSIQNIDNVAVYAVLYDKSSNALGFSRTILDTVPARGGVIAPFTWPVDRKGSVISIEVLPVAE